MRILLPTPLASGSSREEEVKQGSERSGEPGTDEQGLGLDVDLSAQDLHEFA